MENLYQNVNQIKCHNTSMIKRLQLNHKYQQYHEKAVPILFSIFFALNIQLLSCLIIKNTIMSSLKDRIKSKIKSKNEQQQTMEAFDQNSLKVTLLPIKNQLTQIKIQCSWTNTKNSMKIPKLNCKWYNRTENNMQQIVGLQDESYQPSIVDLGSIIQITCVPQLPGIAYEGMPILLKTNIITLAPETQTAATQLISYGKANFFIDIRQSKIKNKSVPQNSQGFIKVQNNTFYICHVKFGQLHDQVLKQTKIDENCPQLFINRKISRELTIKFNEDQYVIVYFKNHDMRDTFCLLNKLAIAKMIQQNQQKEVPKIVTSQLKQNRQVKSDIEIKLQVQNNLQKDYKAQKNERQQSPQRQRQETKQISNNEYKHQTQINKQSASELLQMMNMKLEIKRLQTQNIKLLKDIENQKQKNYNLELRVTEMKERLDNSSKNYFSLQKQLIFIKQINLSKQKNIDQLKKIQTGRYQEILYYKNQIKLLSQQKCKLEQTVKDVQSKYVDISKELQKYQLSQNSQSSKSYNQLLNEANSLKQINNELKLRYEYSQEEKQKIEQNLKNSRHIIQNIESEKKYIQKKYESLSNQIGSPMMKSRISERSIQNSINNSVIFDEIPQKLQKKESVIFIQDNNNRQRQIFQLKKQVKQLMEENNYVRSLLIKEKKSTSKSHIKLQLFQIKKIVSRLSETMIEKDLSISNLKEFNKQLNKKNNYLESQLAKFQQEK